MCSPPVFNGDIGVVERIDPVEQEVSIRFDDRLVKYDYGELDEVSLAYAVSIHKSQGRNSQPWSSRWPCSITCFCKGT